MYKTTTTTTTDKPVYYIYYISLVSVGYCFFRSMERQIYIKSSSSI